MCYVTGWYRGEKRAMKFAILRIWPQPTDHSSYFCMVDPTKRRTGKNAPQIVYKSRYCFFHCLSITLPRAASSHSPEEGSAIFRRQQQVRQRGRYWRSRLRFHRWGEERRPYFPNQKEVNDLIRDLSLTKCNAELLTFRLKQWNLLDESVQVTDQRKRHETISNFFSWQQCGLSIRGYRQPVTWVNGAYS